MNKLFYLSVICLLSSCIGENAPALSYETHHLDKENKEWFIAHEDDSFIMIDNNRISQSFTSDFVTNYYLESSGGIGLVTTYNAKREYIYRYYFATFGTRLFVSLTAKYSEYNHDVIFVSIDDYGFEYDFKRSSLTRIQNPLAASSYDQAALAHSSIEMLDHYVAGGTTYNNVLHFKFDADKDLWKDNTVTDIYYAKEVGLVSYRLHAGIVYERK